MSAPAESASDFDFDFLVIGAGSGGVASARRAASFGARVAICEERRVGGTCVLRGCVPKKLLMYGSEYASHIQDAAGFGWDIPQAKLDWPRLMAAKERELDRLNGIYISMLDNAGVTRIEGRATLRSPHEVMVGERLIRARYVLVATGGHPMMPPIPGIQLAMDSEKALSLTELPRSLAVVGGGYIGVEMASIFAVCGVPTTLILRGDRVLRGFDHDLRAALENELLAQGVKIMCETDVRAIERVDEHTVQLDLAGEEALLVSHVLYATGRRPSSANLGLEAIGVEIAEDGAIVVDEWSATSVPNVFAVGDVTSRPQLTPTAIADGRKLAAALFGPAKVPVRHDLVPTAIFSQPPAATVGLSEEDARAKGHRVAVYRSRFRPMRHTLSGREQRAFLKLVVDADSDLVLGVHLVCADAPEIIQGVAIALTAGATKAQFDDTTAIHPSTAEELVLMREPAHVDPK